MPTAEVDLPFGRLLFLCWCARMCHARPPARPPACPPTRAPACSHSFYLSLSLSLTDLNLMHINCDQQQHRVGRTAPHVISVSGVHYDRIKNLIQLKPLLYVEFGLLPFIVLRIEP